MGAGALAPAQTPYRVLAHICRVLPDQSKHKLSSFVTGFQKLDFQQVNLTLDTPVKVITCLLIQVKGLDTTSPSYTGVDT